MIPLFTWNTSPGWHGPEKMVEVIMKTPSDGTSSTADSTEHAARHVERNASVSSVEPSPTAPNDLTSKTQDSELRLEGAPVVEVPVAGGSAGDSTGTGDCTL